MAPCWPTLRQDVPKKANLDRTWRAFGYILLTFFASWARSFQNGRKPKKRRQFITFEGFFGSGGPLGGDVGHLGAMLSDLSAILEQLGDKMWTESAKMSQDSGQERQDEARWRKWAARERNWEPQGGSNPLPGPRPRGGGPPLEVSRLGTPDSDFSWNWRLQLQLDLQTPTANRTGWLDELDDWR